MTTVTNRVSPSCPQFDIYTSRQQVNLFLAGQGSGKSFIAGIISAGYIISFPKCHGFIGANTYAQLSDSTLFRIREVWKKWYNWVEYTKDTPQGNYVVDVKPPPSFNTKDHNYSNYRGKICFKNGTVIFTGSLDNYKAHDGKEFTWAILDETKDTKEEAVKEVITGRLREQGMYVDADGQLWDTMFHKETGVKNESFNPLYILTSPAKVDWINEWFSLDDYADDIVKVIYQEGNYFKKDLGNKRVTISSTYHNQHNLPSNYISNQLANLHSGLVDMLIYGNPFSSAGGEFYKLFNRTKHVTDLTKLYLTLDKYGRIVDRANAADAVTSGCIFNDRVRNRAYYADVPLHISWDFNVHPYVTLTIYQILGNKIFQIDEICLSNPRNRTIEVCYEFIRKYQGHTAGVFVYGDPSGKSEDTKMEKGENNYTIIMSALEQFQPKRRIAGAAPSVTMRGNFINTILEKGYEGIEFLVHNTCVKSIADFVYLKEASDGNKLKEKVQNKETGIRYEKYGHTSDSFDYMICQAFPNEYGRYQAGGAKKGSTKGRAPTHRKNSY